MYVYEHRWLLDACVLHKTVVLISLYTHVYIHDQVCSLYTRTNFESGWVRKHEIIATSDCPFLLYQNIQKLHPKKHQQAAE
jgi:hypothetical protein